MAAFSRAAWGREDSRFESMARPFARAPRFLSSNVTLERTHERNKHAAEKLELTLKARMEGSREDFRVTSKNQVAFQLVQ